jgi:hypothetical protein
MCIKPRLPCQQGRVGILEPLRLSYYAASKNLQGLERMNISRGEGGLQSKGAEMHNNVPIKQGHLAHI